MRRLLGLELDPLAIPHELDDVDSALIPLDQTMHEDLLWAFGAWDTQE